MCQYACQALLSHPKLKRIPELFFENAAWEANNLHKNGFLVSKETVVLCGWESETKIWLYETS